MLPINDKLSTNQADSEISRRLLGIVNFVRLLAAGVLLVIFELASSSSPWGLLKPGIFRAAVIALLVLSILMSFGILNKKHSLTKLALAGSFIDSIIFALLMYSSGGFDGGLGLMLILSLSAAALVLPRQATLFSSSVGVVSILTQLMISDLTNAASLADYTNAGILGILLLLTCIGAQRFGENYREAEALAKSRAVDIANLSQLNDYVVQRMRESIVVLDENGYTRLMNQSAARLLGAHNPKSRYHLSELAPKLHSQWRDFIKKPYGRNEQLVTFDGLTSLVPNFVTLGLDASHGTLIFIEDISLIQGKIQQSKLAALGRLSAGIAHEIRNPLAAISHANQLLSESENLDEEDRYFTNITNKQVKRVNQIIENVLGLTRAPLDKPDLLNIEDWMKSFIAEYIETKEIQDEQIQLSVENDEFTKSDISTLLAPFGESQLRQVIGNLFDNAINHSGLDVSQVKIDCIIGKHLASGRLKLDICDNGKGFEGQVIEELFEPFQSGNNNGTGLGLYIARELCTLNQSTLVAEEQKQQGACFRILFADSQRWTKQTINK